MTGVRPRLGRDDDAVDRMKQQRQKNSKYLNKQEIWNVVNILDVLIENPRSTHRGRVRVHVNEEKDPERNDSGQLMQFAQYESPAETYWHFVKTN